MEDERLLLLLAEDGASLRPEEERCRGGWLLPEELLGRRWRLGFRSRRSLREEASCRQESATLGTGGCTATLPGGSVCIYIRWPRYRQDARRRCSAKLTEVEPAEGRRQGGI